MRNPNKRKQVQNKKQEEGVLVCWPGKYKKWRDDRVNRKFSSMSQVLAKCNNGKDSKRLSNSEIKATILAQALNIQRKMNVDYPVVVKSIFKSHIADRFEMMLPAPFCRTHLPTEDTIMVLETEGGELYEANYLKRRCQLGGGWRRFVMDNDLVEGDLVVFHLVDATRFKVSLISWETSSTLNLTNRLRNLYTHEKRNYTDNYRLICYRRGKVHQGENNGNAELKSIKNFKLFQAGIDFNDITNFKQFKGVMNQSLQNYELPKLILHAYYDLCCSQSAFLHQHLFKGINLRFNHKFVIGDVKEIISETVGIAMTLRTCKVSTFLDKFSLWDRSLKTYEALGMSVAFLRSRLHHLHTLAFSSEAAADRSRHIEASRERRRAESEAKKLEIVLSKLRKSFDVFSAEVNTLKPKAGSEIHMEATYKLIRVEDEIKKLEVLLDELSKFFCHYDAKIGTLKLKARNHELKFQEAASASW